MPFAGLSYYKMHRKLDLVQYNHYDVKESLWRQVFWMDYVRPIKDAPFWNTETQATWAGGLTTTGYKEPGFCRVNSWLPLAMGGEANLYWLWRVHWAGHELMHGSVVDSFGRPTYAFGEVQELGAGFETCRDFITGTRPVKPKLAVHFSTWAWHFFEHQPLTYGFNYLEALLAGLYRGLFERNWRADVVDPAADLADYSVVISPFLPALDEEGLRERLAAWIEAGGTWIATPFTDIRDLRRRQAPEWPLRQPRGMGAGLPRARVPHRAEAAADSAGRMGRREKAPSGRTRWSRAGPRCWPLTPPGRTRARPLSRAPRWGRGRSS